MSTAIALPVAIPLGSAALALLAWRHPRVQSWISLASSAALLASSIALLFEVRASGGVLVTQVAAWPAPYGIALVVDALAAIVLCFAAFLGLAVVVYSLRRRDRRAAFGLHPLLQIVMAGVCGAIVTGDLFNLFVWFEIQLVASVVLISLGSTRTQLAGALVYVTLNIIASSLLLVAIGLLYGLTGTLSIADMAARWSALPPSAARSAASVLFLGALGVKAAVFPFFFWLPASYHAPSPAVSALLAGLLTKVAVYAIIRVQTVVFGAWVGVPRGVMLAIAGLTMLTGVLGAAAQNDLRRILSFHIVSQIGYMVMGLAISTALGVAGAIFFLLHNVVAKSALFLVAGIVEHERGTGDLDRLGALARERPIVAALFLVPALSLAGMPPLSGFVGKLLLVRAGLEAGAWTVTAIALLVSVLTLYSMSKIWIRAFWAPREVEAAAGPRAPLTMILPTAAVAAASVVLGVTGGPFVALSTDASLQLLDRDAYVAEVLAAGGAREDAP